jgi:hypothetical protein
MYISYCSDFCKPNLKGCDDAKLTIKTAGFFWTLSIVLYSKQKGEHILGTGSVPALGYKAERCLPRWVCYK